MQGKTSRYIEHEIIFLAPGKGFFLNWDIVLMTKKLHKFDSIKILFIQVTIIRVNTHKSHNGEGTCRANNQQRISIQNI